MPELPVQQEEGEEEDIVFSGNTNSTFILSMNRSGDISCRTYLQVTPLPPGTPAPPRPERVQVGFWTIKELRASRRGERPTSRYRAWRHRMAERMELDPTFVVPKYDYV